MTELANLIRDDIQKSGPMRLDRYMSLCLYHQKFGYYKSGDPIGKQGDFITAPEVSQMFGEIILAWVMDCWARMHRPDSFNLIELGPGHGTLLSDGLRQAAKYHDFISAMDLHLVETNETLRQVQGDTLSDYSPNWHDSLSDIPAAPSIIIANEFLDCLPIRQFFNQNDQWTERYIGLDSHGELSFVDRPLPDAIANQFILPDYDGRVNEYSAGYKTVLQDLYDLAGDHATIALFIDYGYTGSINHPTLQAVKNHEKIDPLTAPGNTDITAHVNFGQFTDIAGDIGFTPYPIMTQGHFLSQLGIQMRSNQLIESNTPAQAEEVKKSLHRLTAVGEMGDLFKCSALSINHNGSLVPWI
jgi:SAM-dependent MidA family methyltransferase